MYNVKNLFKINKLGCCSYSDTHNMVVFTLAGHQIWWFSGQVACGSIAPPV